MIPVARQVWQRLPNLPGSALLLALVASCAQQPVAHPTAAPLPPPAPAAPAVQPPPGGPVNQGLDQLEAAWHLRSALNVAAIGCRHRTGSALAASYNQFLKVHAADLSRAFTNEEARYGQESHGVDTHMTRVYNYFAWPPAQAAFCAMAAEIAPHMASLPPAQFLDSAAAALARLDVAFAGPPSPGAVTALASATVLASSAATTGPVRAATAAPDSASGLWRLQLGAYSSRRRAEAAWQAIGRQMPALAGQRPHYVPASGQGGLVRLQTADPLPRTEVTRLCAVATSAGVACAPVSN